MEDGWLPARSEGTRKKSGNIAGVGSRGPPLLAA